MNVSTLQLQILVRESRTLKDKRRVIKSLKDRLRQEFNISVAEIDHLDSVRLAVLGIALVHNERRFADQVFQQVLNLVRRTPGAELSTIEMEL